MWKCVKSLSRVWLFATPWTGACQAPPFMGLFQARALEWIAISFSRGSSQPRDWTWVSCIAGSLFTVWATGEASVVLVFYVLNALPVMSVVLKTFSAFWWTSSYLHLCLRARFLPILSPKYHSLRVIGVLSKIWHFTWESFLRSMSEIYRHSISFISLVSFQNTAKNSWNEIEDFI